MARRASTADEVVKALVAAAGLYILYKAFTGRAQRSEAWKETPLPNAPTTAEQMPARATPATALAMQNAFRGAFQNGFSREPTRSELAMFMALSAHETGRWREMWNFNPGNITTSSRGFYKLPNDDHQYANYTDVVQGAGALVSLIARRYPAAMRAAAAGDPVAFSHELKGGGYYEDSEAHYTPGLVSLYREFFGAEMRPN